LPIVIKYTILILNNQGSKMLTEKIRLGIVGLGRIATEVHLPLLKNMKQIEVAAVCDSNAEQLEKARRLFGIERGYTDISRMLDEQNLKIVDICTPPGSHKDLCLAAFAAGVNVMVEKPFVTSVAEADTVIRAAGERKLALHVLHNQSYLPVYRKARKILKSGVLGDVLNVHVKMTLQFEKAWLRPDNWAGHIPGGPLGEVAPHAVLLFLEFLETDSVDSIQAVASNANNQAILKADELLISIKAGKKIGSCCVSNSPSARTTVDVIGSKLWLFVDGDSQIVVKYSPVKNFYDRSTRVFSDILQRFSCIIPAAANLVSGRYRNTLGQEFLFRASLKAIRGQDIYPVSLEMVREEVRILEAAFTQTGLLL
jgi:predicted dehydrogenase